jgi:hypothetical protein
MKKSLFLAFLITYALFMALHTLSIHWTPQAIIIFVCGAGVAVFAHARRNHITILILVLHMGIEWFEWSQEKIVVQKTVFNFLHVVMDFVFLSHELKVHTKNYRNVIILSVVVLLAVIFFLGHSVEIASQSFQKLEPFVIGGILGCIFSHIYFHVIKE